MEKHIRKGASTYVIQCHQIKGNDMDQDVSQEGEIQDLLQKHEKVFQNLPMQLPLERSIEHIIEVKTISNPIKVKPYRYPHHHKTKVERLV